MSRESILKIREAEAEAEQIIARAQKQAKALIDAAERDGKELCRSAEEEATLQTRAMLDQIRERTAVLTARMERENQDEAEETKKAVALRRKIAEKIIMRGLEAKCQ